MKRDELLARWIEGELDAAGTSELKEALANDPDFAREAAEQLRMKRLLQARSLEEDTFTRELLLKIQTSSTPPTEATE